MRKQLSLLLGSAAIMVTVLAAGLTVAFAANSAPAVHARTGTARTGTAPAGVAPVSYQQEGASTFTDTSSDDTLKCTGGSLTLIPESGGAITAFLLSGCTGPLDLSFTVTAASLPYAHSESSDSASAGTITGFDLMLQGTLCSAILTGTVSAGYDSTTNTATISPDGSLLRVKTASCLGVLNTGDVIDYNSTWG